MFIRKRWHQLNARMKLEFEFATLKTLELIWKKATNVQFSATKWPRTVCILSHHLLGSNFVLSGDGHGDHNMP
jgi:hypothetical protein